MAISSIGYFGDARNITTRSVFLVLSYFTFIFLWIVFHNRILLEKLLLKRKIAVYILCIPACYALWFYIKKIFSRYYKSFPVSHTTEIFFFILYTSLGIAIFLSTRYLLERKQFYQTSLLKRETELQQLRSQLNPHFLFNALNNIYSYTLHNDKFGNDLILRLSELMRFILDSSEKEKIPVNDEITFIENYIAFEVERLGKRCSIVYTKNITYNHQQIAPLILFPFIENAFKHGTDTIQKTTVEVLLHDTSNALQLTVKNNIVNRGQPSTKIGLINATRRLELLYPQYHNLQIISGEDEYIVNLSIYYEKDQRTDNR
jgi:LytS/YehU family sensor histidine kinase